MLPTCATFIALYEAELWILRKIEKEVQKKIKKEIDKDQREL